MSELVKDSTIFTPAAPPVAGSLLSASLACAHAADTMRGETERDHRASRQSKQILREGHASTNYTCQLSIAGAKLHLNPQQHIDGSSFRSGSGAASDTQAD